MRKLKNMIGVLLVGTMLTGGVPVMGEYVLSSAFAQEEEKKEEPKKKAYTPRVFVSSQEKRDFSRIIFKPGVPTPMELVPVKEGEEDKEKGTLEISMTTAALVEFGNFRANLPKNIYDIQVVSGLDEPAKLRVYYPPSSEYRYFKLGGRWVLDVFEPKNSADVSVAARSVAKKKIESELHTSRDEVTDTQKQESKETRGSTPPPTFDIRSSRQDAAARAEQRAERRTIISEAKAEDTTITLSSTESFNLAAFKRLGYLWVVIDRDDVSIPPFVEGPLKEMLGDAEVVPVGKGKAFRFRLPEDVYVQPQGGGFIWKLVLSAKQHVLPSASVHKKYMKGGESSVILTLKNSQTLLKVEDPSVGDEFAVMTVSRANARVFKEIDFVDFRIVPAFIGGVLIPKSDGIRIEAHADRVLVKKVGGLNIGPTDSPFAVQKHKASKKKKKDEILSSNLSVFTFNKWKDTDDESYLKQKKELEVKASKSGKRGRKAVLIDQTEMSLAYDMPYEALGYIKLLEKEYKNVAKLPEFLALKAVAQVGAKHYDEGLETLKNKQLKSMPEMKFWRALAYAGLGEFDKAYAALPHNLNFLKSYSGKARYPVLIELAEIALENEDKNLLGAITQQLQLEKDKLAQHQKMALSYYLGMKAKADLLPDDVKAHLVEAVKGGDLLYATKAELALLQELKRNHEIENREMLSRLERIRFAWRGDRLESEINKVLGLAYVDNGQEKKGLNILRSAVSFAKNKEERGKIVLSMSKAFRELFLNEDKKMKPLEALAVYEEFKELTPAGESSEAIINSIVDNLVSVDLLTRAVTLMEEQMDLHIAEHKKPKWAVKAAAISLMNRNPQKALDLLDKAQDPEYAKADLNRKRSLLKARALSDLKRADEAIAILDTLDPEDPEALKLKADSAWKNQRWEYAAEALGALIENEEITSGVQLQPEQAQMILNRAIALNLSQNVDGLEVLRDEYDMIMRGSALYKSFQVVTRPMRKAVIADRDTLMSHVFEVDMFGNALDSLSSLDASDG